MTAKIFMITALSLILSVLPRLSLAADLEFIDPGKSNEFYLEGALILRQGETRTRLGPRPLLAAAASDGAYVVTQKRNVVALYFWSVQGGASQLGPTFTVDRLDRDLKIDVNASGIYVADARAATTTRYSLDFPKGREDRLRTQLSDDDLKQLSKYGSVLAPPANDDEAAQLLISAARYKLFKDQALKLNDPRGLLVVSSKDLPSRSYVERLAGELAEGWRIVEVDINRLGTEGEADRAKQKVQELIAASSGRRVILFFDGLHRLVGLGGGGNDLIEDLAPALVRGDIRVIASVGDSPETGGRLDGRSTVAANFQKLTFDAFDLKKEVPEILKGRIRQIESQKGVRIPEDFVPLLIEEASYNFAESSHPVPELRLLNRLADYPRGTRIGQAEMQAAWSEVAPLSPFEDPARVAKLGAGLDAALIGQSDVKRRIANCYKRAVIRSRDRRRPVCIFLALGASGLGKTFTAEIIKDHFGSRWDAYKLELFRESHTVHTLIGSPPSFVESGKPGALVNFMTQNPTGLLLLDELDKAHADVIQALDPLLDEGQMRDLSNNVAHFNKGTVMMTSNFGIEAIGEWEKSHPDWRSYSPEQLAREHDQLIQTISQQMVAQKVLPPWVIGRIPATNWLIYHHLDHKETVALARSVAAKPVRQLAQNNGFKLDIADAVYEKIANDNYSLQTGARPVKDAIENLLGNEFYDLLAADRQQVERGRWLILTLDAQGNYQLVDKAGVQ